MKKSTDEPTFITLELKNKNRRDAAAVSDAVFYRPHVFSAQSNIRTDRFPETDVNTDYTHHKILPAKEELFFVLENYQKILLFNVLHHNLIPEEIKNLVYMLVICANKASF